MDFPDIEVLGMTQLKIAYYCFKNEWSLQQKKSLTARRTATCSCRWLPWLPKRPITVIAFYEFVSRSISVLSILGLYQHIFTSVIICNKMDEERGRLYKKCWVFLCTVFPFKLLLFYDYFYKRKRLHLSQNLYVEKIDVFVLI